MPNPNNIHVTQRDDGNWQAKREGGERASATGGTKVEVVNRAVEIAKNTQAEVIIHRADGQIQDRRSHGNDPRHRPG